MRDEIRCAVFGLGRLGYWHAENLHNKIKSAKVTKVVSSRKETAEKAAKDLGISNWTTKAEEVFADPDIDAVVISTPTDTHGELIKKAAESGKHIFVEKPVTDTIEETRKILNIVKSSGVICLVGFMRRFDPAYAEAKRRIQAGDIGKPIYYKGVSRDPHSPPESYIKHSGGIFLDFSIHDYDISRFLLGAEVRSVRAMGSVLKYPFMLNCGDADQAITYLTYDSGAAGDVETSRNALYGYDIRGEVVGTEGTIQIGSLMNHDVRILTSNRKSHDIIPEFASKFSNAFLLEMNHFIECIKAGRTPDCTVEDGLIAQRVAKAATESFFTGKEITVLGVKDEKYAADKPNYEIGT